MAAMITATPNPVVYPYQYLPGTVEETTVKWSTGNNQRGKVFVSVNGDDEVQFDGGKNGLPAHAKKQAVQDGQTLEFRLRTASAAGTLLGKVKVTTERTVLPQAVIDAIHNRPLSAQGIYNLDVVPGVDTLLMTFRTRQPTNPFIWIFNDETGQQADFWGTSPSHQTEVHRIAFDNRFNPLAQNTRHRYRINAHAAPGSGDPRDAEATGFFWTGSRAATVFFDRIHVRNDGDPGLKGAGEFRFMFGAGDAATGLDLGNTESWGEGDIDAGQDVDVNRIIDIPAAPRGLWASVTANEDDSSLPFTPGLCTLGLKPTFDLPGSDGVETEACAAASVTQHFDISETRGGTAETPFEMATGDFAIAFNVFGRLRVEAKNGKWFVPHVDLTEPVTNQWEVAGTKRFRARAVTRGVAVWRASRAHAALVTAGGQTHKVLLGPGGAVYHQAFGNGRAGVANLGGQFEKPVTAVAGESGRVHVFGLSPEGAVLYKTKSLDTPSDEEWWSLGGSFVGAITAVPGPDAAIEIFARSDDGSVRHLTLSDHRKGEPHGEWPVIGTGVEGSLAGLFSARTGLSLFATGRRGEILHKRRAAEGKWRPPGGNWERLGVVSEGLISAEWIGDQGLLLAVVAEDETVRVLAWPDYPETPPRHDWKVVGTVNSLLNAEIAAREAA